MEVERRGVGPATVECLVVLLAALGGCALLYGGVLGASWTHDDPIIVRHVMTYGPSQFLCDPSVWREYNWRGFFPVQLLSYWSDRIAFGVAPLGYRLHQLAAIAVLAAVFYSGVRRFGSRLVAVLGSILVLIGPVTAEMAQQLMTRHYVEGAIAALLAWLAVDRRRRGGGRGWSLLASLLFLFAVLAKEVYAPLPLLLLLVYRRYRRDVADALVLMALALCIALLYRAFMIEGLVRSYRPDVLEPAALTAAGGQLAAGFFRVLAGGVPWWGLLGLGGILVLVLLQGLTDWSVGLALAGGAACAVAPTLLVAEYLEPRHGFHVWLLAVAGGAWVVSRWLQRWGGRWQRRAVAALVVITVAGVLVGNRVRWSAALDEAGTYTSLWQFAYREGTPTDYLVAPPFAQPQYFVGARWLREHTGDGQPGPAVVSDRVALCVVPLDAHASLHEVADGAVVSAPGGLQAVRDWCRSVVRDVPVTVRLRFAHGKLEWRLGPYGGGRYEGMLIQVDPTTDILASTFPVPREGGAWMPPGAAAVRLVVVYHAPEGWIAMSPELHMDLVEGLETQWPPSVEDTGETDGRSLG